ncbi:MAG: VWA domain-containing protein [Acidobacteriota bacterium]
MSYRFADPQYLLIGLLIPLLVAWYFKRLVQKSTTLRFSHGGFLKAAQKPLAAKLRHLPFVLRMVVISFLLLAFARPQSGASEEDIVTEGIDIVLVLDLSSSMLAEDIQPNRIEASKQVASEFIQGRKNDRIGMVVFAREGYTQCPLTLDYGVLLQFLEELKVGTIEDGTAIGMGLSAAVNRLKESKARSKVIILLTDGRNNAGEIDPVTAAQMAQAFGIRIYAIGAGTRGLAPYPVDDPVFGRRHTRLMVDIDESTLKKTAELTGGRYFRATDRESLEKIYGEINRLEKTEIQVKEFTRYGELFYFPLLAATVLLFCEIGLANIWLRKIP